jgi:hypothetical protein
MEEIDPETALEELREVEETGPFQPTAHHGIPIDVPGRRGQVRYGPGFAAAQHPPIDCPGPRYPASLRGRYRCPACGEKVPLEGTRTGREIGYELADAAGEFALSALGQVWWLAVSAGVDLARAVRWAVEKLAARREKRRGSGELPAVPELESAWKRFHSEVETARERLQDEAVSKAKDTVSTANNGSGNAG